VHWARRTRKIINAVNLCVQRKSNVVPHQLKVTGFLQMISSSGSGSGTAMTAQIGLFFRIASVALHVNLDKKMPGQMDVLLGGLKILVARKSCNLMQIPTGTCQRSQAQMAKRVG
jgi:hypothetical protein